jgi:hypothetical protein
MFCPKCGAEYVEGVTVCADCGTPLEDRPPAEDERQDKEDTAVEDQFSPEEAEFEEILTTFNAGDIAIIKSLLDGESIEYFIQGEHFNYVDPLIQPARLMVRKDQVSEVREILRNLDLEYGPTGEVDERSDE